MEINPQILEIRCMIVVFLALEKQGTYRKVDGSEKLTRKPCYK